MKLRNNSLYAAIAVSFVTMGSASAAITISGTFQSWDLNNSTNTSNFAITGSGFDASGFDKLVVVATSENGNGGTGGSVDTMTYDGVSMTRIVFSAGVTGNITYNSIWYLDNPTTTAGVIATTGNNRIAATAFGLNGTAAGAGATASTTNSPTGQYSVGLTTTAANSFVVASLGMGGSGNNADVGNVTANSPLTRLNGREFGSNWGGHVVGTAAVSAAGAGTYGFTDSSPTNDVSTIAVEFKAIPEPSVALLGGLGVLALLRRRRA